MPLAELDDINVHLPQDKLVVLEADDDLVQIEAERLIRGQLSGVFDPTVLATWTTPANTPDLIRGVAGRLIAAFVYSRAYSEDSADTPQYAQKLYDEAMNILRNIASGAISLLGIDNLTVVTQTNSLNDLDFWPNDDTNRKFTMADRF